MLRRRAFIIIPFLFYFITSAPTIGLGDTALLVEGIQGLKINTHVNNHNITVIFGWLLSFLPIDSIAFKATLVSVLFGGITIAVYYELCCTLFRSRIVAASSALILMVSHSMWWHSSISEVYAVNALFTVIALYLLVLLQRSYSDRLLYLLFGVAGLALFNHVQMGFIAVGAAFFLAWRLLELGAVRKYRAAGHLFLMCSLSYVIGFLPYLVTFLKDVSLSGDFGATLGVAFGGDFRGIMFKGSFPRALRELLYLIHLQFPSLFLAAIPVGLVCLAQRWKLSKALGTLIVMFCVNTGFFMYYNTWDKFAFMLPSFIMLAFCGSLGIEAAWLWAKEHQSRLPEGVVLAGVGVSVIWPVYYYSQLTTWARSADSWYARYENNRTENTHNAAEYIANPNKMAYYDVQEYANLIFDKLPKGAIYVDDDARVFYPIEYYRTFYGKRPDLNVQMVNSFGFDNWGLTRTQFERLVKYCFRTDGDLFLVSVKHPLGRFIASLDGNLYHFKKYPLDEKRWIYRLATASDIGYDDTMGLAREETAREALISVRQDSDLKIDHILYTRGATVHLQRMTAFGNSWKSGNQVFIGAKLNSEAAIDIYSDRENTADLRLRLTRASDFGVIDVYLNDVRIVENLDLYSKTVSTLEVEAGAVPLKQGDNLLRFDVVGKNDESDGYFMGIDSFVFGNFLHADSTIPPSRLVLDGRLTVNLRPSDIMSHRGVQQTTMQDMKPFGAGWEHDDQLFVGADAAGAEVSIMIRSPKEQRASMRLVLTSGLDFGQVDIFLNYRRVKGDVDLFSSRVKPHLVMLDDVPFSAGYNHLLLRVIGKNARSRSYNLGIDVLSLIPRPSDDAE